MAVNIAVALADGVVGPSPSDSNGMVAEDVVLTPATSNAGDTGTYTTQFLVPNRVLCGGPIEYSIAGNVVTFKTTANLDNGTLIAAKIIGYATGGA